MDFAIGLFVFFLAVAYVFGTCAVEAIGRGIARREKSAERHKNRLLNGDVNFNYWEKYYKAFKEIQKLYNNGVLYDIYLNDEDLKEYNIDENSFRTEGYKYINQYTALTMARAGFSLPSYYFIFDINRKKEEEKKDMEMDMILRNLKNAHPELNIGMTKRREDGRYLSLTYDLDVARKSQKMDKENRQTVKHKI